MRLNGEPHRMQKKKQLNLKRALLVYKTRTVGSQPPVI